MVIYLPMKKQERMKQPVIEVKGLSVSYGKSPVLWDINLTLFSNELIAVIGPNGAGKSTFLKALLGFVPLLSGSIAFFDKEPLSKVQSKVAYVPQAQSVDWNFPINCLEVVMMGAFFEMNAFKWASKKIKEKAKAIMDQLGILELSKRPISELSGGQKQKLFIARALMQDAELYLLDEPFVGIDHTTQEQLLSLFKKMRDLGKTLVIIHHDLNSVESIFDSIVLLNTYLVASGPTKETFNASNLQKTYGQSETILSEILKGRG